MDVRCDRCQTEYELEDASVSEHGTEVECSDCGHTFKIKRAVSADDRPAAPPVAEWLLETRAGQSHRLRDLTLLQKWIIERKVTRDDKISRSGQAWRRLGEIVELLPFFDVVDEADRAKATAASSSASLPQMPMSPSPISPLPSVSASLPQLPMSIASVSPFPGTSASLGIPSPSPQSTLGGISLPAFASSQSTPSSQSSGAYPAMANQGDTALIPTAPSPSKGLLKLLLTVGVATGVAYVGIAWFQGRTPSAAGPVAGVQGQPAEAEPERSPPPKPTSIAITPTAPPTAAEEAPTPSDGAPEPTTLPSDRAEKGAHGKAPGGASPYQRLLGEGERFQAEKQGAKARQRYEQALAMNRKGTEALVGLGEVALGYRQHSAAIAYFKRALHLQPAHAEALFGLAEAQRLAGQRGMAIQTYRRYLRSQPEGWHAAVVRGHLVDLEGRR